MKPSSQSGRRLRIARTRALQGVACLAVAWVALHAEREAPATIQPLPTGAALLRPQEASLPGAAAIGPGLATIEIIVRRNDTLDQIFRKLELSLADLANIRALAGARAMLDRLMPGEALRVTHRDGALIGLQRNLSLTEQLRVFRAADGFRAAVIPRPIETRTRLAHGVIDSSLFDAGNAAGLQDATVMQLAKVFGWDVDFARGLRAGDAFSVSYQRLYQDGKYLQDGPILAASFTNDGQEYRAVRYAAPDGTTRYYTPDGHSMQKAFLRAPLEFRRVSSGFSRARFHPILQRIRAHEGTDYAAPSGTPVYAAGDGRVRFSGVRGGYGNVVELEHGSGIVTVYGHLSRFAPHLHVGAHVEQGETIAYVGMTGLATGPHLHYEYRVDGRFLDPQHIRLPDATPIDPALRADFLAHSAPLLAALAAPASL